MKKFILILGLVLFFSSCQQSEKTEFWKTLNCYMAVNKTDSIVVLQSNYPRLTKKELQPQDTFKALMEWTEREHGMAYKIPFFYADTCILTIKNKEYHYNKQDSSKGNPLFFDNYKVEKITDIYFNIIFYIEEQNYVSK